MILLAYTVLKVNNNFKLKTNIQYIEFLDLQMKIANNIAKFFAIAEKLS